MSEVKGRRDAEVQLIERAWKDPDFRNALISNPKQVIEDEFGVTLPEGLTVHVHEETADSVHLTIPHKPDGQDVTVLFDGGDTKEQLEMLSAAAGPTSGICTLYECHPGSKC